MAGSEAEERIRGVAEAALRRRRPSARIIHELVLDQGTCRIDLASVTEDEIVLVEIKSERDVLKRLGKQLGLATRIANETWLCIGEKHAAAIDQLRWAREDRELSAALRSSRTMIERDGLLVPCRFSHHPSDPPVPDVRKVLMMLWAAELQHIARPWGGWSKPRYWCMRTIVENMNGREIRRAVCDTLRRRPFARADDQVGRPLYMGGGPLVQDDPKPTLYRPAPTPAEPIDWEKWKADLARLAGEKAEEEASRPRLPGC
jgi:hypothetical protein